MMLKRSVLVLFSLLGIEGCNFHTGPISESLNPESMDLKLLVCKVRSSILLIQIRMPSCQLEIGLRMFLMSLRMVLASSPNQPSMVLRRL